MNVFFTNIIVSLKYWFNIKKNKSSIEHWAEREIELACIRERSVSESDIEWDYGCACYNSALRAYKSLLRDDHSGYSIEATRSVLNRLIDGNPLTPIEDTPDVWNLVSAEEEGEVSAIYQCKRMSSLFKNVYKDFTVKYTDYDRTCCIDINDKSSWCSSWTGRIIDKMYPITMPYWPTSNKIKVYCSDLLTDSKNGDFDSRAIHYIINPDGERIEINRYFKEGEKDWVEIDNNEWAERCAKAAKIAK